MKFSADLVTFTEKIPNGKLHFFAQGKKIRIKYAQRLYEMKAIMQMEITVSA